MNFFSNIGAGFGGGSAAAPAKKSAPRRERRIATKESVNSEMSTGISSLFGSKKKSRAQEPVVSISGK